MNADELFAVFETNLSKAREQSESEEVIVRAALSNTVETFWDEVVADLTRLKALPAAASALRRFNSMWDSFLTKANYEHRLAFRLGSFKLMVEKKFPDLYRATWNSTTRLTHL